VSLTRRRISKVASLSVDDLVKRRSEATAAEREAKRLARQSESAAAREREKKLIAGEQAALDKLAVHPQRGMKGCLCVSEFVSFKVQWVGRWKR